ncbi:P-loop containing nucleoside triphosphate hydrolase protein [Podospora didyma]|uniref:P-loop containing nucleoside triphosphate hydrolase protein n=1 Tax=Podospora didyma TaxID=330526 RepID=A0AAE0NS39_9PEZI|nr:P-loop containing nucleoside triphosphate hydrolase protein [Podospora didyma]
MAANPEALRRAARLNTLFREILSGKRQPNTPHNAQLFLEAIQIQESPSACIESIVSSKSGLAAIRDSIRSNLSSAFMLSHTLPFLQFLSHPSIKALADGGLLRRILLVMAKPPTIWNALVEMSNAHQIPDDCLHSFAWLALELVSLPSKDEVDVLGDVQAIAAKKSLLKAEDHGARELGYKIERVLQIRSSTQQASAEGGPGGRHDNDHDDFRMIDIYPTTDEFLSTQQPYYQTAHEVFNHDLNRRASAHLDNQFRLLREDMLAELREDLQAATGGKKGKRNSLHLGPLVPMRLDMKDEATNKLKKCTLLLTCHGGLQSIPGKDVPARKKFLKEHPSFLRHQSFGVLCRGKDIFGFAFVDRDLDLLANSPPVVSLQFTDSKGLRGALLALALPTRELVRFILVDTPVFAYEPVLLGLKAITDMPLQSVLVNPKSCDTTFQTAPKLIPLVIWLKGLSQNLASNAMVDLESGESLRVDGAQLASLILALSRPLSCIQGPPGTGKSFIGARIAKYLFKADQRILVLSYTNHALDQFMEDLQDVGIPDYSMVRIGSRIKCTDRTRNLLLSDHRGGYRRSRGAWGLIDLLKHDALGSANELEQAFEQFQSFSIQWTDISEHLEFSSEDRHFYDAFKVPSEQSGWSRAGKRGRLVGPDYLYRQWVNGGGPGIFENQVTDTSRFIWEMPRSIRDSHAHRWRQAIIEVRLDTIQNLARQFNDVQQEITVQFDDAAADNLRQKKIIGCTTTGAAKYSHLIRAAKPDVILVEEAGEILESHILTALAPSVKQLILIGDHKQLRPKINNYALSVEKGEGFDLNRSLFERLIMQGTEHTTLRKQHRMVPEISVFPRHLTYPDLLDGPMTYGREPIRGLQDHVVFVNHGKLEDSDKSIKDRRDPDVKESKRNPFEAELILRIVKYFGQQGYSSKQLVVLTPYLGQLRVLQDVFRNNQEDPELSDMDKRDLIRAGLLTEAASKVDKHPLRISTIDNYQGEESDIVIASLTRSNESGDIGFMSAPERLNVLITRARNCLVLVGNMETFIRSKKGKTAWLPFFDLLKTHNHLYDGFPIKCERHPDRTALLKEPIDFDKSCPDGGCTEPCIATLKCGIHKCRSRCHRVTDHSKTNCNQLVEKVCDRQHKTKVRCGSQKDGCQKCIKEDKEQERRIKRDLQLEEDRQRRQEAYFRELQVIQDEIEHQRRKNKYEAEEEEQKKAIAQQHADLASLKDAQKRMEEQKKLKEKLAVRLAEKSAAKASTKANLRPTPTSDSLAFLPSNAQEEWEHLKEFEGAQSKPMDELMAMIGLEDVKQEFLGIKSKVDTAVRQGISMASERFNCTMLGNPGTGKTTVARLYAQFLTEVGVIPGTNFHETTGSKLANLGVSGCKKAVEDMLNDGGGVFFIDEAYQLTSGNNPGGGAVVDYLLAEVENLRGKIVFVSAGYSREMESFYAHNPGLPSRFPIDMKFADYTDDELLRILELKINKKYNRLMDCEDGLRGLYCRIVTRRIGRGRGKDGFGNARTVENTLDIISSRQAGRLRRARKRGSKPDDLLLTKEDLIGPEPSEALTKCEAWKKLQELIGLQSVKEAVKSLVDSIQQNYQRELDEQPLIQYSLNKVFLGNPGTGKTTVAKLYGSILVALGMLSKGEVVVRNPSDFIGAHLGQSEQQTKGILAVTTGKVLVIDEAYGLYGGGGSTADPYKTAAIDTIVAEVQSVPGDDRCVLLLGYKDQMETMFQNVNPGLSRRFPIASGFTFDDFSETELRLIFDLKLKQIGYTATDQAAGVAMEMLKRARNRPNFGNAGEIDIILDATKARHQRRVSKGKAKPSIFEALDFDENFDRAERSETNVEKLFEGTVGCDDIVARLRGYQDTVKTMKLLDLDPKENIPFNFLFRGPPGTGKTTTAKKMGKVFYDMGFLSTAEVIECSASDLVGQYVGQTGPKVQQLFDKALGKVLFVDEAYRLGEGHFAKEAMDEIVDSVTKDKYFKRLIIILAGYEADINRLMTVNAGLTSRFPEVIDFRSLTPLECISLLLRLLQKKKVVLKSRGKNLDLSCLESPPPPSKQMMIQQFENLAAQDNWASARDVGEIAKAVFNKLLQCKDDLTNGSLILTSPMIHNELRLMLDERTSRSKHAEPQLKSIEKLLSQGYAPPSTQTSFETSTAAAFSTTQAPSQNEPDVDEEDGEGPSAHSCPPETKPSAPKSRSRNDALRDAGVSDAVWEQLQRDREAEGKREDEYRRLVEASKKATADARDKIVKRLLEEEKRRKEEVAMREKLAAMGICPAGYQWVKQAGGYRCTAGGHFMSEKELGIGI